MLNKKIKKIYKNKIVIGHKNSDRNPKMSKFINFKYKKIDIIKPLEVIKNINKASKFIKECASMGGVILYVGTKKQIKSLVKKYADKVHMPYIINKWPAGLLTNIRNTRLSIKNKNIIKKQKYTIYKFLSKKEKMLIDRKYNKINKKFGTIYNMNRLPIAIIIIDVKKEIIAVKESIKTSIYSIGIVDTDSNPDNIDYPIPANDDLSISINYILKKLTKSIIKGLKVRKKRQKLINKNEYKKDTENFKIKKINKI